MIANSGASELEAGKIVVNSASFLKQLEFQRLRAAWRDDHGNTWLAHAPNITMLPLVGHQREPRPITWAEQRAPMLWGGHGCRITWHAWSCSP